LQNSYTQIHENALQRIHPVVLFITVKTSLESFIVLYIIPFSTVSKIINHTCILVFTTSMGVLPNTEQAPAKAPNIPVTRVGIGFLGSPHLYMSLHVSITKKRIAWLLPCFNIVAVTPLYSPPKPEKWKQRSKHLYKRTHIFTYK
jgi:hypothetical protein